jgi:CRP/FNR family cyclic AMP-dependent transcriptional regulator
MQTPDDAQNPLKAQVRAAELREVGLFGALSDEVLEHLAATLKVVMPNAGDVVFREGDDAREMYVVLSGEIEVLKRSRRSTDARVALLGAGDWFGEMSILDVQPRSATVRAIAPSRLLVLSAKDLDGIYRRDVKSYAIIVLNVARELSRRLRVADGILADFVANVLDEYVSARHAGAKV